MDSHRPRSSSSVLSEQKASFNNLTSDDLTEFRSRLKDFNNPNIQKVLGYVDRFITEFKVYIDFEQSLRELSKNDATFQSKTLPDYKEKLRTDPNFKRYRMNGLEFINSYSKSFTQTDTRTIVTAAFGQGHLNKKKNKTDAFLYLFQQVQRNKTEQQIVAIYNMVVRNNGARTLLSKLDVPEREQFLTCLATLLRKKLGHFDAKDFSPKAKGSLSQKPATKNRESKEDDMDIREDSPREVSPHSHSLSVSTQEVKSAVDLSFMSLFRPLFRLPLKPKPRRLDPTSGIHLTAPDLTAHSKKRKFEFGKGAFSPVKMSSSPSEEKCDTQDKENAKRQRI